VEISLFGGFFYYKIWILFHLFDLRFSYTRYKSYVIQNEIKSEVITTMTTTTEPKFIILEGVDRSGKDSMQDAIDAATRYKHIIADRGPIGFQAYCEIFKKSDALMRAYNWMEKDFAKIPNILVIYLTASTEELVRRCEVTNHEILDFDYHKSVYEKYLHNSPIPSITVDSTNKHVTEIVKELVESGIL
jgi:thymidylate kinase